MTDLKKYVLLPLILIGALNWGLVGILSFDLVGAIFGSGSMLSHIIYSIVGIAAITYIALIIKEK